MYIYIWFMYEKLQNKTNWLNYLFEDIKKGLPGSEIHAGSERHGFFVWEKQYRKTRWLAFVLGWVMKMFVYIMLIRCRWLLFFVIWFFEFWHMQSLCDGFVCFGFVNASVESVANLKRIYCFFFLCNLLVW